MVKSFVAKLSTASNLALAATFTHSQISIAATQTKQETNYMKNRNDPGRFFGDGVQFKAKLIGILEVGEARGDRMCQEALQDLKMAIRAAGEHKQRITIHVTIDGLRLRDEKTSDSLYHHPVHKISFIAQDMTDSRAFGYIFGSPDSGHRFFGIKTDKAASQVVLAMRDLFQVVFELKKKEIELARQQIQSKSIHDHQLSSLASLKNLSMHNDIGANVLSSTIGSGYGETATSNDAQTSITSNVALAASNNTLALLGSTATAVNRQNTPFNKTGTKELSPESVADLVDLELELSSIQRGITQMERITPNEHHFPSIIGTSGAKHYNEDPFGDSFTNFPAYNLLPPPESDRSRYKPNKTSEIVANNNSVAINTLSTLLSTTPLPTSSPATVQPDDDESWLQEIDSTANAVVSIGMDMPRAPLATGESTSTPTLQLSDSSTQPVVGMQTQRPDSVTDLNDPLGGMSMNMSTSNTANPELQINQDASRAVPSDAFTDLDPLGIGRTRPYVDKKYFFQDLKNPPKRVLKDMSPSSSTLLSTIITTASGTSTAADVLTTKAVNNNCAAIKKTTIGNHSLNSYKAAAAVVDEFLNKEGHFEETMMLKFKKQQQLQTSFNTTIMSSDTIECQYRKQQQQHATKLLLITTTTTAAAATTTTLNTNNSGMGLSSTNINNTKELSVVDENVVIIDNMMTTTETTISPSSTTTNIATTLLTVTTTTTTTMSTNKHSIINDTNICTTTTNTNHNNTLPNICQSNISSNTLLATTATQTQNLITTATNITKGNHITTDIETITRKPIPYVLANNICFNHYNLDANNQDPVMLPRDTDPFSPTRKKSDPFQDGDIFSNIDPFEFKFSHNTINCNSANKINSNAIISNNDVFSGPLQVSLPPEESQNPQLTLANNSCNTSVRSRPVPSHMQFTASSTSNVVAASTALKQQTAEVICSISQKKMPHLFGQTLFSKRGVDSNSINMRRLQESDSLSETEAAPEPPPRPDSVTQTEPPPLPPKKQFNDIVIRPRVSSGTATPISTTSNIMSSNRYEFLQSLSTSNDLLPPIPLPSRRVVRSDGTYPGPGRPRKPNHVTDGNDYMTPIVLSASENTMSNDGRPTLLPPPVQTSTRMRVQRQQSQQQQKENAPSTTDIYENKHEILQHQQQQHQQQQQLSTDTILPDITLTQLLTLGIDELAVKLNVPTSKLSTMTLVELTRYLSEFLEGNKQKPKISSPTTETAIFRVHLDQQTTFMAKFDDTFGEDLPITTDTKTTTEDINSNNNYIERRMDTFVANFTQFNEPPVDIPPAILVSGGHISDYNKQEDTSTGRMAAVPPADRYAVFREIIDQDLQQQQEPVFITTNTTAVTTLTTTSTATPTAIDMLNNSGSLKSELQATTSTSTTAETADVESVEIQAADGKQFVTKIDTKITEVVAQAKDRYAALRDIILVENLFDSQGTTTVGYNSNRTNKKSNYVEFTADFGNALQQPVQIPPPTSRSQTQQGQLVGFDEEVEEEEEEDELDDDELEYEEREEVESSLDSNEKEGEDTCNLKDHYEQLSASTQQLEQLELKSECDRSILNQQQQQNGKFLTVGVNNNLSTSKDDLEIDALMQRAISNLSLDSRERTSPAASKTNVSHMGTSPITLPKTVVSRSATAPTQSSPVLTELSAVTSLISSANKHIGTAGDTTTDTWATFEPSRAASIELKRKNEVSKKTALLTLPPAPPSNASQNDTAESPCSSDPRDDNIGGSLELSACGKGMTSTHLPGESIRTHRRWPRKEHHQTSSSSRDLSPWDDELPSAPGEYQQQQKPKRCNPNMPAGSGYYMCHNRRMNSCDEDYEYEDEYNSRREHHKFKQGISRSRDNFDLASPSWYYYPPQHAWSAQDTDQTPVSSRARTFERPSYERPTYAPAIYDKRGVALPPSLPLNTSGSYERRSAANYDKRGKYYRDFNRAKYDFDEYSESMSKERRYRETGSFEKPKARNRGADYENVYEDSRLPCKSRAELMYERDRKLFDRGSIDSFESATRRRRSFGSGDIYGCLERTEDSRERYGIEKTRSLRKSSKLRAIGDIDYEQDSESEFHHQRQRLDTGRGVQRPNQLTSISSGSLTAAQTRMRKSSGSSPWDGEESSLPGQKIWKRPSSAAENERRLTENRRATNLTQTPSGSEGESDRRSRKKQRGRGNKNLPMSNTSNRYPRENYDYMTYQDDMEDDGEYADEDYDAPPTDDDKFERINRRRRDITHQRMFDTDRIKTSTNVGFQNNYKYISGEIDADFVSTTPPCPNSQTHSAIEDFSFDGGFESDFIQTSPAPPVGVASSCTSTPAASATTPSSKSAFRFSNDFSERDKTLLSGEQHAVLATVSPVGLAGETVVAHNVATPKLRFDDHVRVSQIEDAAFEDDFAGAHFVFDKEELQWSNTPSVATTPTTNTTTTTTPTAASTTTGFNIMTSNMATKKQHMRNSKLQQRSELIKKSESVNIFAKRVEDPFEDDEFFKSPVETAVEVAIANVEQKRTSRTAMANGKNIFVVDNKNANINNHNSNNNSNFQWIEDEHENDSNFAKFDENM